MVARGIQKSAGGLPIRHRNGVLQLRALDFQVGQLRLRGIELGFGLRHVGIGSHAAGVAVRGSASRYSW